MNKTVFVYVFEEIVKQKLLIMKKFLLKWPILLITAALLAVSCSDDDDDNGNNDTQKTIAATVEGDARFTLLLDALTRTNLVDDLADAGAEFTVFAPNDAAFTALLGDMGYNSVAELETALTTPVLRNILLYHVLGAKVTSDMVATGYATTEATNADGDKLSLFTRSSGGVSVNGISNVEDPDIMASNGVIHEVTAVLMPLNIVQLVALNTETYSSLTAALGAADGNLVAVLSSETDIYTVFAPDDDAFADLLTTTGSADLNELITNLGGTDVLANVLLYHVVSGNIRAEDLSNGPVPTAFPGNSIDVVVGSEVTLNGTSTVKETNIQGTNGVVHRISAVLQP